MNKAILEAVISSVRLRVSQADCPVEPAQTIETLENAVTDLAGALAAAERAATDMRAPELLDALIAAREALASAVIEASGGMFDATTVGEHLVIAQIDAALANADRGKS